MASIPQATPRAPALPRGRSVPRTLAAGLALLVVAALGLFQVLQTSRAATAGYELSSLERERSDLSAQVRLLEADVAQRARVDEVRTEATQRLGMVPPKQTVQITVDAKAPARKPLPDRYVVAPEPLPPIQLAWWERLLQRLPGFK